LKTGMYVGGTHMFNGRKLSLYVEIKKLLLTNFGVNYEGNSLSNNLLRGGPAMLYPSSVNSWFNLGTSDSKKVSASVFANASRGAENVSERYSAGIDFTVKPGQSFTASVEPSYSINRNEIQYVTC